MSGLKSFEDLPIFLSEAQALGSNIVYLVDYWEGVPADAGADYGNKGDYIPRSDLGGAAAFTDGIRKSISKVGGSYSMLNRSSSITPRRSASKMARHGKAMTCWVLSTAGIPATTRWLRLRSLAGLSGQRRAAPGARLWRRWHLPRFIRLANELASRGRREQQILFTPGV